MGAQASIAGTLIVTLEWCGFEMKRKVRVKHGRLCTMVMVLDVTL